MKPSYCTRTEVPSCSCCSLSSYGRDCHNAEIIISLVDYAKLHGREISSVRQKALRGGFKTARKIGRNWVIDRDEPYHDYRRNN